MTRSETPNGRVAKGLLVAAFISIASAQIPKAFEVASVKAVPESVGYPPRKGYWLDPKMESPQRFRALNYALPLIEWAYHVRDFQVVGGPAWIRDVHARFEIQATAAQSSNLGEMRQMAQALLEERFHLKLHREMREMAVYALIVGKGGARLEVAKDVSQDDGVLYIGQGKLTAAGVGMETFVKILTEHLERPAIDRTGLDGRYDFTLNYEQASLTDWRLGPALFGMVQDLGLRLETRKEQVEMLVIDSIAQPSAN